MADGSRGGRRERNVSCWLDKAEAEILAMALRKQDDVAIQSFVRTAVLDRAIWVLGDEVTVHFDVDGRLTFVKNEQVVP